MAENEGIQERVCILSINKVQGAFRKKRLHSIFANPHKNRPLNGSLKAILRIPMG